MKLSKCWIALFIATGLNAATIDLVSSSAGTFTYGLTIPGHGSVSFATGDQITFSGLSGVTGESVASPLTGFFGTCGFTSTTACFQAITSFFQLDLSSNPSTSAGLVINSSATTTG